MRARSALEARRNRVGSLFVIPAVLFVLAFFAVPLGYAFYISLTNWPLIGPYRFIGTSNYSALAHDAVFVHSLIFTVEYTAIVVPSVLVVGYALASFVRNRRRGSTIFRTLLFIPFVVGLATESYMLLLSCNQTQGWSISFSPRLVPPAPARSGWCDQVWLFWRFACSSYGPSQVS